MKNKKRYVWSIVFFLLLIFLTYQFIFLKYSVHDFLEMVRNCNINILSLSFLCIFMYFFAASIYLKKMFRDFDVVITWKQAFVYVCIEVYFSAITPSSTGGQPVQIYYMTKDSIPLEKSTIVILLNTILYKLALILMVIVFIICFSDLLFLHGFLFNFLLILGIISNIIIIILFYLMIYSKKIPGKIFKWGIRVGCKLHFIKPEKKEEKIKHIESLLEQYHECALFTMKHPFILIRSFLYMLLQRFSLFLISYVVYRAFGFHEYQLLEIVALQTCITIAMDCVPFPGGVMVSEGLTFQVNMFLYGSMFALSSMLVLRGISFYFVVLLCGIFYVLYLVWGKIRKRKKL